MQSWIPSTYQVLVFQYLPSLRVRVIRDVRQCLDTPSTPRFNQSKYSLVLPGGVSPASKGERITGRCVYNESRGARANWSFCCSCLSRVWMGDGVYTGSADRP